MAINLSINDFTSNPTLKLRVAILLALLLFGLWTMLTCITQILAVRNLSTIPEILNGVLTNTTFETRRWGKITQVGIELVSHFIRTVSFMGFVLLYFYTFLWTYCSSKTDNVLKRNLMYIVLITTAICITEIPQYVGKSENQEFEVLNTIFVSFLASIIINILVTLVWIQILRRGQRFFTYYLICFSLIYILAAFALNDLFLPAIEDSRPLEEGELKTALEELTSQVGFPITQIRMVHSPLTPAYYAGVFVNKRIVISDAFLDADKLSTDDLVAVVAHELGHWQNNGGLIILLLLGIYFLALQISAYYLIRWDTLYTAFRINEDPKPFVVGLFIIWCNVFVLSNYIIGVIVTSIVRYYEVYADDYAANTLHKGKFLRSALIILGFKIGKNFPADSFLYVMCNARHPPPLERIEFLDKHA